MARDLLSISIIIVAFDCAFSIGAHVINKYRSRLLQESVETMICYRNWLDRFVESMLVYQLTYSQ
ncbi:MAG: hAT transposon family protein, partial [Candidatus Phytoplasma australasiaticum]|nr:hAT transposon family protein [Candidatus Phytoplasma australasiaticum]